MQRFCEDCGSPLSPGMAFCENCGAKIDTEESAAPAPGSLIQAVKDSADAKKMNRDLEKYQQAHE